ncbi:hypothetical protein C7T94_07335 [Pedobacter yulinensis]|uniref:VCBS repeat-containing protein n=1 Tax=Pedobacter yulinensis TaxID=2126353 RepID=A0A2T3HJB3_9SPHI|nr:hypothetical protein [Pedobacter yulinensis]PST82483.1 hypothetical protein C7T94_07335 [Pedobacter yulinensis]
MKVFKPVYFYKHFLLFAGVLFCFACTEQQQAPVQESQSAEKKQAPNPFEFYKSIEVKPGLTFEILQWGKGVDSVGGYLVLMSDSAKNNFRSLAAEREGVITDAWNMDLDTDGNPEIYVQLQGSGNVSDLNVYEFSGNNFNKITFPGLPSKKGYAGHDKFTIRDGDLYRSYPVQPDPADTSLKAGSTREFLYMLRGNSFSVGEVNKKK